MRPLFDPAAAQESLGPAAVAGEDPDAARERYATIVWSHLVEPGDAVAGRLVLAHGWSGALRIAMGDDTAASLTPRELAEGRKRWLPRLDAEAVTQSLRTGARAGVTVVTRADAEWPQHLDDLGPHAPHCLWIRGEAGRLTALQPAVAIVGARAATSYGEHVAMELAADLAGGGVAVVSGGAYGIDGAAHRAALMSGGVTVALLAGGVDRAYPAGHAALIGRVATHGVVVSEVPCGSAPTKWRFLQRNRLIAALTQGTVVVEAGWRSGSLNTAGHAAALGRALGAVPGPITSAASAGCHRLLREYGASCITSADDVRELIGADALTPARSGPGSGADHHRDGERPATDDTTRVTDALSTRSPRAVADIARRAGMAADQVEAILGLLHLEGAAAPTTNGWRLTRSSG